MAHPAGRKIGFTNRGIWKKYGVHEPIWGFVYDETLIFSRKNKASVSLRELANPRIEPEICFKLASAPPRTSDPGRLLALAHPVAPGETWTTELAGLPLQGLEVRFE